ncbi:MAG: rhomboid family intramembrane serine protease [Bacteroidia bacterium]
MQLTPEHISVALILINVYVSYQGFSQLKSLFEDRYIFDVDRILIDRDYKRLVTSGFLHGGWAHLLLNMYSLYIFSAALGTPYIGLGILPYLFLYFISLVGGNLTALFVHRNHGDYRALGASGAVSGVMFAAIVIFPGMEISFIYPPIPIAGWVFALGYVLISIYGSAVRLGNIGHEAHLGGAVTGMIAGIIFRPYAFMAQPWLISSILIFMALFLLVIARKPEYLFPGFLKSRLRYLWESRNHKGPQVSAAKGSRRSDFSSREEELNHLLDKLGKLGMKGLSEAERKRLKELSDSRDL